MCSMTGLRWDSYKMRGSLYTGGAPGKGGVT